MPTVNTLFELEALLRAAASAYAASPTDGTRKRLRDAAIEYADNANALDGWKIVKAKP